MVAALAHTWMNRYKAFPGQSRLKLLLTYGLIINWALVGLSMHRIHTAWLADPGYLIESLMTLWAMAAMGPKTMPWGMLFASAMVVVSSAAWDAWHLGLDAMWPTSEISAGLVLLVLCLWQLSGLLMADDQELAWHQPTFWLFSSWTLMISVELIFYPLRTLFLRQLSREWILVPWYSKYFIGLILNLGVARTFLCPKPSSS
ncbi:MAG: hypothetical protein KGI56_01635 [Acidobacteriota bacterium]|nr:hypothetical protein [Acidobacteriota bacterium]